MTTNVFERYGLEHLSPSTCNKFVTSPAAFVLEKVLKRKAPVGCAAHRGTAVEAGLTHGLLNPGASVDECSQISLQRFDQLTALSGDPVDKIAKERAGLAGMTAQALEKLRVYGAPTSTQGKVELHLPGLSVPMVGYFDFHWENYGITVDLKTTHALPSKISVPHARQGAFYAKAKGDREAPRIAYATPKKSEVYAVENVEDHIAALTRTGLAIQKFLSISADPAELVAITMPDVDHYFFNEPTTRQMVYDVWGV
jgi:hypothetical protein